MGSKILITAPSLEPSENVSGISALVRPLVVEYPHIFKHIVCGTTDREKGLVDRVHALFKTVRDLFHFSKKGDYDVFHLNTSTDALALIRDSVVFVLATWRFQKVIVHFHGGYWLTAPSPPIWVRLLIRMMVNKSHATVVLGREEVVVLRDRFGLTRNIHSLPNFFSPDLAIGSDDVICKQGNTLLFMGRLVSVKSVDKLADILKAVRLVIPNAVLTICGDGPLKDQVLESLKSFPPDSWRFLGIVSGAQKIAVYRESDVFILPSIVEGMPVSMLEAMASKCICVVTNLGVIPSVISNGLNGYIVQPGDIPAFAAAVVTALTSDDREKIRHQCVTDVGHFSIHKYVEQLSLIYA